MLENDKGYFFPTQRSITTLFSRQEEANMIQTQAASFHVDNFTKEEWR